MEEDTTARLASALGIDWGDRSVTDNARVRLVIPVRGEAVHLERCIEAAIRLAPNESMEIVVVDDGYTGTMNPTSKSTPIRVVRSSVAGDAGAARNAGAAGFDGEVLVFVDSDVVVEDGAVARLIRPLLAEAADATVGNYSDDVSGLAFLQQYKQLYLQHVYSRRTGYITNQYWTALSAISAKAFREVGGFRSISGGALGEDTLLGQRLTAIGASILAVPTAQGKHLKEYTLIGLIGNDFRKGMNSFDLFASSPRELSGFRHSGPRDIGAVALSWALAVLALHVTTRRERPVQSWLIGASAALYLWARSDLLHVFARRGPRFVARAAPLMIILDITRGGSVAAVLVQRVTRPLLSTKSSRNSREAP